MGRRGAGRGGEARVRGSGSQPWAVNRGGASLGRWLGWKRGQGVDLQREGPASLGGRSRPELSFGEPGMEACAPGCGDPASCLSDLDQRHWENFFRLAWCREWIFRKDKVGSKGVHAGRGGRPGVRACGCVHERGPGATHTHTHTLTRPHPRRALGRAARASPDLHPQAGPPGSRAQCQVPVDSFSLTQRAGFGDQDKERRQGLPTTPLQLAPHSPLARGRGCGEDTRGSYRSGGRVRAAAPGGSRPATSAGPAGTRPEGGPEGDKGAAGPRPRPRAPRPCLEHRGGAPLPLSRAGGARLRLRPSLGNCFSSSVPGRENQRGAHPWAGRGFLWICFLPLKAPRATSPMAEWLS